MRNVRAGGAVLLTAAVFAGSGAGTGWADTAEGAAGSPPALPEVSAVRSGDGCLPPSETVIDQRVWTEDALGLPEARGFADGDGVTVAVVGGGVDDTAAALDGAVQGAGEDCTGFGTFLAGVVAARGQDGSGMTGVAPAARILAVPVAGDDGAAEAEDVAEGIERAVDGGAGVVLVGAAVPADGEDGAVAAAVRAAAEADALVVAPASAPVDGGTGKDAAPALPGSGSGVLAVAATGPDGAPAAREPAADAEGRPAPVDLAAPGQAVMSVGPGGDGHFVAGGDPVAAAFVAGTAALVRSREPGLTAGETAERLVATAYPAPGESAGALLGAGTLDPVAALTAAPAPVSPESGGGGVEAAAFSPDPPSGPAVGRTLAVVGGSALLILILGLGGAALRYRRARQD
ncbi:S8 family serine peptidase [Nocardiopsis potens]|uniref:S8 family serine peptidase n=1 Tax=Nocardiopsis potens TaxID=1246458 RepID=UPI00037A7B21|nr:S8 family serine peptidase [Nocardiopsis potens]